MGENKNFLFALKFIGEKNFFRFLKFFAYMVAPFILFINHFKDLSGATKAPPLNL